uniref:C-type lectin domain-containing protein n=1 Tax=Pelodiscus sinensis TaxID=13735 RepID=K7FQ54_PELSI
AACPEGWVGYGGKCYYFSEKEGNWNSSRNNCSSFGASLAGIDSLQEKAFLLRYKGLPDHWIRLRRKQDQAWKYPNNNVPITFSSRFEVSGEGECPYLNQKTVGSSRCYTKRNWIFSKP